MKIFYHSADLDGHCSGAIIKWFKQESELIGINYGQEFPWDKITVGEEVYMVDFSLQPFSDMERLNSLCKLYWIDHHKTAIDDAVSAGFLASGGQYLYVGKAACELAWGFFSEADTPMAVWLLGRYDVWDHTDSRVLPFQYGMRQFKNTLPDNDDLWHRLFWHDSDVDQIVHNGELILQYEKSQNKKFCKAYCFETTLNGMVGVCANRGFTNSKLFDSVYDPDKHHLMITFVRLKPPTGKWTVSLYSTRDDVDCGEIAKSFGGGGHKGAAGFQCEQLPFEY